MRATEGGVRTGVAEAQAERIASLIFIAARGGQLVFSTLMVANDRRRYARPVLQAAVLAGIWLESGWLSNRLVRARRYDDRAAMWIDTASAAGALLISQRGLGSEAAAPWAKNVAIGSAIGASTGRRRPEALAAAGAVCSAAIATGLRARGREAHVAGLPLAVNDAVSWMGTHLASSVYLRAHRRYARLRDDADSLTIERAAAAASEAERSRQHQLLHGVTIEVLGRIADSEDVAAATSVARAEAARLRYALRTGGRIAEGLDQALAELAEQASAGGLRVELVTAELADHPSPGATAALREATERALAASREFGDAHHAVVRAASDEHTVSVSVRDHGRGFTPGTGTAYEQQLLTIGDLLRPWQGTLATWSEPDAGVRISLTVPIVSESVGGGSIAGGSIAGRSIEDAAQGGPDIRIGQRSASDHEHALLDGDIDPVLRGRGVDRAEHEVGVGVGVGRVDEVDLGRAGDALEPGAQQRRPGGNTSRGDVRHHVSVTPARRSGMGRITQFGELSAAETKLADRTLLAGLLAWRATGLITGAVSLVAGSNRYRSRTLAFAQLALATGESAWFARRVLAGDRWNDDRAAQLDAAAAAATLVLGHFNLEPVDRSTWINWAPWSFAANVICGQAMGGGRPKPAAVSAAAVIGAHAAQSERIGDAIANAAALSGFYFVARSFADQIRAGAVRLEQARNEAVYEGRRLAEAREQSVQLRLLHDHALQTLETIASGRFIDLDSVRSRARLEASRLRRQLDQRQVIGRTFRERLAAVLSEHAERGLAVEFGCPESLAVDDSLALAFCGATNEALTNVGKHAGTKHARVTVKDAGTQIIVTITDQGIGFDQSTAHGGFGMDESIHRRMRDAGGLAATESAPGAGTRVTLSGPA